MAAWEKGASQGLVDRALTLLALACPESSPETLASLSIGRRDACLLDLREWAFGSKLASVVVCPRCRERLEMCMDAAAMRPVTTAPPATDVLLSVLGVDLRFRLANSNDLKAVADLEGSAIRSRLFERCLLEARSGGETLSAHELPEEVVGEASQRMAEADPQADVQFEISCPSCAHRWSEVFDIVSFLWSELDAWARRVLAEVHTLALAYGWREGDILALSPSRRQLYLEMVAG